MMMKHCGNCGNPNAGTGRPCLPLDGNVCGGTNDLSKWQPKQPIRPPQCTTYAQLHEHMVRLYKMCEGTSVTVLDCIRKNGGDVSHVRGEPIFDGKPEEYEFALGIVEGKPVFRGDVLFVKRLQCIIMNHWIDVHGRICLITEGNDSLVVSAFSWNPPLRTIKIGDVEVPAPEPLIYDAHNTVTFGRPFIVIQYDSLDDALAMKAALEGKQP